MNNMATVMAEDVCAPELRNPLTSGIRVNRKSLIMRIVNHLLRQKK